VIDVMAKDPAVQEAARLYLPHMVAAPLLGALAWMLDGVFIGATRTQDMRNMMILSFLGLLRSGALAFAKFRQPWALDGNEWVFHPARCQFGISLSRP